MPERKIIYEENPEDPPDTPEDVAVEVDSIIGMTLRQIAVAKTLGEKIIKTFAITDIVRKCRDKLKSFNN